MGSIDWRPTVKKLREFGIVAGIGFCLIALVLGFLNGFQFIGVWIATAGMILGFLTVVIPGAMKWFYYLWMGFGFLMGNIVGRILLVLIYYVVCTGISCVMRCTGRDRLELKRRDKETYWKTCEALEARKELYERQF